MSPGPPPGTHFSAGHEGRLADVLQVVGNHADQPHPEGDWRIPAGVHDPAQLRVVHPAQELHGAVVHRLVISDEQLRGDTGHLRHLVGRVAESGDRGRERQLEALEPAGVGPHLVALRDVGEVIVLHAGEVPDQPADRVRAIVHPGGQVLRSQPADNAAHRTPDASEAVDEQVNTCGHASVPSRLVPSSR